MGRMGCTCAPRAGRSGSGSTFTRFILRIIISKRSSLELFLTHSQNSTIDASKPKSAQHGRGIARQHLFSIYSKLSYRIVSSNRLSALCLNSTASPALRNPHLARRRYRAPSASACRTAFASAAHPVACRACLWRCLVMLWLVPGRWRAWSALESLVRRAVPGAPVAQPAITSKLSQPSAWIRVAAVCASRAPW